MIRVHQPRRFRCGTLANRVRRCHNLETRNVNSEREALCRTCAVIGRRQRTRAPIDIYCFPRRASRTAALHFHHDAVDSSPYTRPFALS